MWTPEEDAAIATLSEAQEAQLGEMREYYTEQFSTKVSDLQADLDAKQETIDADIPAPPARRKLDRPHTSILRYSWLESTYRLSRT